MSDELTQSNSLEAVPSPSIERKIYSIRGTQVILDEDIAFLYGVPTKRLNEQVKRNKSRFPQDFMFQLSQAEFDYLRSQFATANWNKRRSCPYAFTELGVSMLSSILTTEPAIQANVQIMRAFAAMRHFLASNAPVFQRLENLEYKLVLTDQKVEKLFSKLEEGKLEPRQGIFFDGQVFDAYSFVSGLVKQAKQSIILFDNYIDETVLTLLDKRGAGVSATIYTKGIGPQLRLDIQKHNTQYAPIDIKQFGNAHDRFLVIDQAVYHMGASLKDLGKKWFAFSLMEDFTPDDLLGRVHKS